MLIDLAACEAEDQLLRQRMHNALHRLQADREDLKSILGESQRAEDDLDQWREKRHVLLHTGLREALASVGDDDESEEGSVSSDAPLQPSKVHEGEDGFTQRTEAVRAELAARPTVDTSDAGNTSGRPAPAPAGHAGSPASLQELLAGGQARIDAHNSTASSRHTGSRPGSGNVRAASSRPSTAQQHRLAFEARGSLMASLAEREATRQVHGRSACRPSTSPIALYAPSGSHILATHVSQRMLAELQGVAPGVSAHVMIEERMRSSASAEEWVDSDGDTATSRHWSSSPASDGACGGLGGGSTFEATSRFDGGGSPSHLRPPAGSAVAAVPFVSRTGTKKWLATKPSSAPSSGASAQGAVRARSGNGVGAVDPAAARGSSSRLNRDVPGASAQAPVARLTTSGKSSANLSHSGSASTCRSSALPLCKALQSPAAAGSSNGLSPAASFTGLSVGGSGAHSRPSSASSCSPSAAEMHFRRLAASTAREMQPLGISERELAERRMASELVGSRRVLSASSRRHSKSR